MIDAEAGRRIERRRIEQMIDRLGKGEAARRLAEEIDQLNELLHRFCDPEPAQVPGPREMQ